MSWDKIQPRDKNLVIHSGNEGIIRWMTKWINELRNKSKNKLCVCFLIFNIHILVPYQISCQIIIAFFAWFISTQIFWYSWKFFKTDKKNVTINFCRYRSCARSNIQAKYIYCSGSREWNLPRKKCLQGETCCFPWYLC